jgi:hypothetical protein
LVRILGEFPNLAGVVSVTGNPLLDDFLLLARKLEKLGFVYNNGQVIIIPPSGDHQLQLVKL